ncbi:GATA zinc finger domain-containing protein 1-like [Oopsacas minuta]|uniref:GATA zinc finger domain-containing protein 1-like n=1 Tax=Oopsacas minuta TaxID=111878 RepID=A0AAV7KHQ8_9METZ|nr:GATA zinc finger domain-containing protein 1-like [Oopsacas minuta]
MTSDQKARRSSRGSISDTSSLPCPSPTSSTATSVSCTLCGTKESLVWLPQVETGFVNQTDQFVLCANCTAAQHPATYNTRQSNSKRQRNSSTSSVTNSTSVGKKKEKIVPSSSTATQQPIPEETPAPPPPEPTSSNPFRKPRKGKPSRVYMQPSTSLCDRVFHDGIRFEPGDIVSLIDRDNQGIYYAMIRGLISDIEANKFAFLTWLLPLEPVHVKSLIKPSFLPSKYCMGPHDYAPRRVACLRFECSSPLSASYKYPKNKIDSPFM